MLLDQFCVDQESASRSPLASGAASIWNTDDVAVHWLNVAEHASHAFAQRTEAMREVLRAPDRSDFGPDQDPSVWLERGAAALWQADPFLVRSLRAADFRAHPVIVVRGLPSCLTPPATPYDGVVDLAASCQAIINLHAVLACLRLHPIAYARENASILHAVCPVMGARGEVSSHGYDTALPFHTDYADRPIDEPVTDQSPAATTLAFAVERDETAIPMECVPTRRLLSALSSDQINIGRSEEFAVKAPDIFGGGHATRVRRLFLSDAESDSRCRLNLGRMTGLTTRASHLLREIRDILSRDGLVETIRVRRGDIVVMDNQRAIHRRAPYTPRWDGTDRYFIRISAAPDPHAGLPSDSHRPWVWS